MSSLGDIQLNIIVNVQGLAATANLSSVVAGVGASQARVASGMTAATTAAQKQAAQMQTLHGRLSAAEQAYDAVFRASYRLQIVGYQLIGAGQKILEYVKGLTDEWGKFEFTLNRAAGALQVWKNTATGVNPVYGALIDNVLNLTKELRIFPAEEVAKATYFWASTSGQAVSTMRDLESVMKSVNPLMKIAALTQTSYEIAIKGVYSIIVQYGKSLSDVGDVTAKLHLVTQRTALEFPDLINSFKFLGPVAASLGVSFEEVAKTLGQIGDAGIRGSMAGRALRQMFIQTVRPAAKARAAMDALFQSTEGINKSFQDVAFPNGKFIGLTGFVHQLAVALQNATMAQKAQLLATISTANELPVLTALVANEIKVIKGLPGAYDTAKASVDDAGRAAIQFKRSWELLADSWKGITGRITAGIQIIKIRVGRELADALTPAIARFTEILDKIELWVKRNPELVRTIGKLVGAAGAFSVVAGAGLVLIGSFLGLASALSVLAIGFGKLIAPAALAAGLLGTIAEVIFENLTRIRRVLAPAFKDMLEAFGITKLSIEDFRDALSALKQPIHDIVSTGLRILIPILKSTMDLFAMIAKSPVRGALEVIARVMVTIFSLRLLANILGITKAFVGLVAILKVGLGLVMSWSVGMVSINPPLRGIVATLLVLGTVLGGVVMVMQNASYWFPALTLAVIALGASLAFVGVKGAIAGVASAIGGLKNGLLALVKASPLIVITALALLATTLYDMNFLGVKEMFRDVGAEVKELGEHVKDLVYDLGPSGKYISDALKSMIEPKYQSGLSALAEQMMRLDAQIAGAGTRARKGYLESQRVAVQKQYDLLLADQLKEYGSQLEIFGQIAHDNFTSTARVSELATKAMRLFGLEAGYAANTYADQFLKVLGEDTELTVEKAVQLWNNLMDEGVRLDITPEMFIKQNVSKEMLQQFYNGVAIEADLAKAKMAAKLGDWDVAYPILVGLQANSADYSEKINGEVTGMLAKVPESIKGILTETEDIASKGPKAIFDAITTAISDLGDIQARFEAAIEGGVTPTQFANLFFGNVAGPQVQAAFASDLINMNSWAVSEIDGARTSLAAALAATADNPEQREQLAQGIIGWFNSAWKQGFDDPAFMALDAQQRAAIKSAVDTAFTIVGQTQPTAAVVQATAASVTKNVSRLVTEEMNLKDPTSATPFTAGKDSLNFAVEGMRTSWNSATGGRAFIDDQVVNWTQLKTDMNLRTGGLNTFNTWISGVRSSWYAAGGGKATIDSIALYVARSYIGTSPPPDGPLHNIDKGGFNIMAAWGGGLEMGGRIAISKAIAAAQGVNTALAAVNGGLSEGGQLGITSDAKRHLVVEFEISSPDGSVAAMQQADFERALKSTNVMRNIEHMAAVRGD